MNRCDLVVFDFDGAGVRLAVVSTNSEANVVRILGGAAACIDYFGCGAPMFGKQRHTRRALRATGVTPARALCIGDELRDADAARAVGAGFVPVGCCYTLPSAFEAAGHAAIDRRRATRVPFVSPIVSFGPTCLRVS